MPLVHDDVLAPGKEFPNIGDAKTAISVYNDTNFTNLKVSTNNSKSLVFECKHGRERKSKGTGKRPKQHYNYLGCQANVRMYKTKDGKVKVTKVNLEHNHKTTEEIYRLQNQNFSEEERELVLTLSQANAKPSQIKRVLCERNNKQITTQNLRNFISKFLKEENLQNNSSLEELFSSIESNGGNVNWTYDCDDSVDSLFVCTAEMKKKFVDSNPFSIQMDTTFNVEKGRYKLVAFCYLDIHSNKSEIAAFALISQEADSNFSFILSKFKALHDRNDYIFLVDKDFNSIDCIKQVFTDSTILLCVFHVLKFMKNLVATAYTTIDVKHDIFAKFKSLVYCPSESLYEARRGEFLAAIKDVQVVRNNDYVSFIQYYQKNWESCAGMWVKFYRNSLPLLGDHTTNRIERQFWSLKLSLKDTFGTLPDTVSAIIHLVNFTNNRLSERRIFNETKTLVIFDADVFIHELNKEASRYLNERGCIIFHTALKNLCERENNLSRSEGGVKELFTNGDSKVYKTTQGSCDCTFRGINRSPCHHILLLRKDDDDAPMFEKELFDERYMRKESIETVPLVNPSEIFPEFDSNENSAPGDLSLTDREKYRIITPILTSIGNLVSCHSTKSFLNYVDEFKVIENLVRKGKSLLDNSSILGREDDDDVIQFNINDADTVDTEIPLLTSEPPQQEAAYNSNANAEPSSQYNLKFKKKLKSKGRPKNTTKQLTFNKTSLDNKKKKQNKRKKKGAPPPKKVMEVTNEMQHVNDDDEDYSGSELLDVHNTAEFRESLVLPISTNIDQPQIGNTSFDVVSQSFTYLLNNITTDNE